MSDAIFLILAVALVCGFFFFLINRDVRKVEKDFIAKEKKKKAKA